MCSWMYKLRPQMMGVILRQLLIIGDYELFRGLPLRGEAELHSSPHDHLPRRFPDGFVDSSTIAN